MLQQGLQRFAKPWWRISALRVFLDKASLAASPELWGSIEDALKASRWFILLASPEAANSLWVDREVTWWLANKSPHRLLVVATAARLRWDKERGDWAADSPVPPSLRGAFAEEPLWVDLTALRPGTDRRRARVPDEDLATIAAPLRNMQRDTLIGEHLRQHRRTMRLVRGVIAVLTTLLVFAAAATVVAVDQRDAARTQARIATSRQLAALSGSLLGTHLDVAQLLAIASYQTDQNPQTRAALMQAGAASPQLVRYVQAGAPVTALGSSADGSTLVAGTSDGQLMRINPVTGRTIRLRVAHSAITALSVSTDGGMVAALAGASVLTWAAGSARAVPVPGVKAPSDVATSPSGKLVGVLQGAGTPSASLLVREADGTERKVAVPSDLLQVRFPSETSVIALNSGGPWQRMNSQTLHTTAASTFFGAPAGDYVAASSPDGSHVGYTKSGGIYVWPTSGATGGNILSGSAPDEPASALAIRADGGAAAVAQSGTVYVVSLTSSPAGPANPGQNPEQLTGLGDTDQVTFVGHTGRLASAAGSTIALWNTAQDSRLSTPTGFAVPFASNAAPPPVLLTSTAGGWLSLVDGNGTGAWLLHGARWHAQPAGQSASWAVPIRDGDKPLLIGTTSEKVALADASGQVLHSWASSTAESGEPVAAGMMPDSQVAVVNSDGSVQVLATSSTTARQLIRGSATYVSAQTAAVSPDGSAAVIAGSGLSVPSETVPVRYVDLRTGNARLVGNGGANGVIFTPENLVIQRTTGSLEVWDLSGRKLLRTLPGAGAGAGALAVSPDGQLLARLRQDGTVSIIDFATGDILANFSLPKPTDSSAADPWTGTAMQFTADGRYLLTATEGGQMIQWNVAPEDLERGICVSVGRSLTPAEWRQYVHTTPPARLPCAR